MKEAIFREQESQQEKESDIEESEEEGEFWFHFQGFVDFVFFVPCCTYNIGWRVFRVKCIFRVSFIFRAGAFLGFLHSHVLYFVDFFVH